MDANSFSAVTDILTQIDSNLHHFVFEGYGAMVDKVSGWLKLLVSITVAGFGWALMRGRIDAPVQHVAQLGVKIGAVVLLATNWHHFSALVYDLVSKGPDEISMTIMRARFEFFTFGSIESGLQKMLAQGLAKSGELFHKGGFTNLTPCIIGLLVFLVTILISGLSVGLLVLAKAGLAVCLILAPMMLVCYLYESTKNITEKWAQHLIGFALMPIGIHAVMLLILVMANNSLDKINKSVNITLIDCASYLLIGVITIPLMLQVKTMVASIAQGFSFSTMGAFGQTAGIGVKMGKGVLGAAKGLSSAGSKAGEGATQATRNILQSVRRVG